MMVWEDSELTWFSVELREKIAINQNIEYERKEFKVFWDMIKSVENESINWAIANITITSDREKSMNFTQPIYDSWLQLIVSKDRAKPSLFNVIWESWIVGFILWAFLILLVVAHIIWYFERGWEGQDYFRDEYKWWIRDAFWRAFIVVTMWWFENERPENRKGRIFAVIWVIIWLFFVSSLTAQITTSLTVSELASSITSYHDLVGKKVWAMEWPTIKNFLWNQWISVTWYQTPEQLYSDLRNWKIDAVVWDAPIIKYYVATNPSDNFLLVWEVFKKEKYGMILPTNSSYIEKINQEILSLQENWTYNFLLEKYFGQ